MYVATTSAASLTATSSCPTTPRPAMASSPRCRCLRSSRSSTNRFQVVCHRFDPLPQVTKNVRYRRGEEGPTEDAKVCAAIAGAEQRLNGYGRLIVRPSGTEPVIRVTAEGDDPDLIEEVVDSIVDALNEVAL